MEGQENKQMERVESRIITLRGQQVIIDRDVAELYGVGTLRMLARKIHVANNAMEHGIDLRFFKFNVETTREKQ